MKHPLIALLASSFWGALLLTGCNAPRDPELERQAFKVRLKQDEPVKAVAPASPSEVPPSQAASAKTEEPETQVTHPLKRYTEAQVQEALKAIAGEGQLFVTLDTDEGSIRCSLDERAPQTLANFIRLGMGLESGHRGDTPYQGPYYDGLQFHRIQPNFIIQTGNPTGRQADGVKWVIERETGAKDRFETPGALAMVDSGKNNHGSQFFIALRAQPSMAERYSAFGSCENLEVVRTISRGEVKPSTTNRTSSSPLKPVTLRKLSFSRAP